MTRQQVSERYHIPMEILKKYESWEIKGSIKKAAGSRQYDDADLERLSLAISLYHMGFENPEVEAYMKLSEQEGTEAQRARMLGQRRHCILDEIHSQEKLLEQLDDLRYHICGQQEAKSKESKKTYRFKEASE